MSKTSDMSYEATYHPSDEAYQILEAERDTFQEYCRFCGEFKDLITEDCACPEEDRYDKDGVASYE